MDLESITSDRICRCCLSENELQNITEKIVSIIERLCDIKISIGNAFNMICDHCNRKLEKYLIFRTQIIDNDSKLKGIIEKKGLKDRSYFGELALKYSSQFTTQPMNNLSTRRNSRGGVDRVNEKTLELIINEVEVGKSIHIDSTKDNQIINDSGHRNIKIPFDSDDCVMHTESEVIDLKDVLSDKSSYSSSALVKEETQFEQQFNIDSNLSNSNQDFDFDCMNFEPNITLKEEFGDESIMNNFNKNHTNEEDEIKIEEHPIIFNIKQDIDCLPKIEPNIELIGRKNKHSSPVHAKKRRKISTNSKESDKNDYGEIIVSRVETDLHSNNSNQNGVEKKTSNDTLKKTSQNIEISTSKDKTNMKSTKTSSEEISNNLESITKQEVGREEIPIVEDGLDMDNSNESIKELTETEQQLMQDADEKRHKCELCDKSYALPSSLSRHMKRHKGVRHHCDCGASFASKHALIDHKRIKHTKEQPYFCDICSEKFFTSRQLNYHKRIHTKGTMEIFKCSFCSKGFREKTFMEVHQLRHSKDKAFLCDICPAQFKTIGNFKDHMKIHTGEKPYQCKICDKTFRSVSNLHEHELIHKNEEGYICSFCDKIFKSKNGMRNHKRTHTK